MTNYGFTITPEHGLVTIRFNGRLSRNDIKILREEILNNYSASTSIIIINMNLGEPSSLLVSIFLEVLDIRNRDGKGLAFCEMDRSTQKALQATGVLKYALSFDLETKAREYFNYDK
jgi:hypothetical protein